MKDIFMKTVQVLMLLALIFITTHASEVTKNSGPDYTSYSSYMCIPKTATTPEKIIHVHATFNHISREYSGSSFTVYGCEGSYPLAGNEAQQKYDELEAKYYAQPQKAKAVAWQLQTEPDDV